LTKERKKERKFCKSFFFLLLTTEEIFRGAVSGLSLQQQQTLNKRKHKRKQLSAALVVHDSLYIFKNDGRRRSATPRTRPSEEERTVGG